MPSLNLGGGENWAEAYAAVSAYNNAFGYKVCCSAWCPSAWLLGCKYYLVSIFEQSYSYYYSLSPFVKVFPAWWCLGDSFAHGLFNARWTLWHRGWSIIWVWCRCKQALSCLLWISMGYVHTILTPRPFHTFTQQILMIEMVTADGQHIKFGPTSWEEADEEGAVPKTTKVSGVCNIEGEWKNCPNPPKFEDLWKAMRGGGGGKMRIKATSTPLSISTPVSTSHSLIIFPFRIRSCSLLLPSAPWIWSVRACLSCFAFRHLCKLQRFITNNWKLDSSTI